MLTKTRQRSGGEVLRRERRWSEPRLRIILHRAVGRLRGGDLNGHLGVVGLLNGLLDGLLDFLVLGLPQCIGFRARLLAKSVRLRTGLLEHPRSLGAGVLERLRSFVLRSLEMSLRRVRSFSRLQLVVRLSASLLEHARSLGAGLLEHLGSFLLRALEMNLRRVRSLSRLLMLVSLSASLLEHAPSLGAGPLEHLGSFLLRALEEHLRRVSSFSRLLVLALEVLAHALELELARLDLAAASTRLVVSTPKLLSGCVSCLALNPVGELYRRALELEGLFTSRGAV